MAIPQNGKIVIIDDRIIEEALPLMKVLSQNGVAYIYYSGRPDELPNEPLQGIRLVFLDLRLEGIPESFDEDDIRNSIKPVIERIISKNNGPYIIIGWTNNPHELESVINSLDHKPIIYFNLDKSTCLSSDDPLQLINKKLQRKITEFGKIGLLFKWENFVNVSAYVTTNNLLELIEDEHNLENILFKMSEATLGKHVLTVNTISRKKALFQTMNSLLLDTTSRNVLNIKLDNRNNFKFTKKLNDEQLFKLNAKLLLNSSPDGINIPGNVYLSRIEEVTLICKSLLDDRLDINKVKKDINQTLSTNVNKWSQLKDGDRIKKVEKQLSKELPIIRKKIKKIFIEVTPICDFSQDEFKVHRVIAGLLFPVSVGKKYFKEDQKEGAYYKSNKFYYAKQNDAYQFLINYRGFVTVPKTQLKSLKPIFSLNQALLFEIQHRTSAHFSRPGLTTVV